MAINPFRKGGSDTIPVAEGGTGGTTASSALSNLGGLDAASHALIDHSGLGGGVPTGTVIDYAGSVAPPGWLECNGSSYTTAGQATLFAALGYAWGGSGPNFNVPDLRRRTTVGRGGTGTGTLGNVIGNIGGEEAHIQSVAEMANHGHGLNDSGHSHQENSPNLTGMSAASAPTNGNQYIVISGSMGGSTQSLTGTNTNSNTTSMSISGNGSSVAANVIQPSAVMMKIIKA